MSDSTNGSQGQLFSDAAVGAPSYDEVDTDLVGYRGPTACAAAGITYRQLDYWARTGLVAPSVRTATGSGTQRLYSFRDILVLKVVKRLLDTGVSLQNIRKAVDHLRNRGVKDLANVTLLSDGATVYECTSAEEVVDLLAGGQGVFGIAVSGALAGLVAEETGARPGAVEPWLSAHAVLGLYASLLELARDQVLAGVTGPELAAELRRQGRRHGGVRREAQHPGASW